MSMPRFSALFRTRTGSKIRDAAIRALKIAARVWRRCLVGTRFIAITGSLGKTTTKELAAACIGAHLKTSKTSANRNQRWGVSKTILTTGWWHRVTVCETGCNGPDTLMPVAELVRPDIAVILAVAMEHRAAFRTLEAVAREKARLMDALPRGGIAWLNGDDPRVAAMQPPPGIRRKFFGTSPQFDLWADDISGRWPDRLELIVHHQGSSTRVRTRLVGEHWVPSVLAAIGVSLDCGITLEQCAAALARVEPTPGRMQPVTLPSGATLLRDEVKGGADTVEPAFHVLREARGVRRWLVTSGFEETSKKPQARMKIVARSARGMADVVVFVGDHAGTGYRRAISEGFSPDCVFLATDLRKATEIVRTHTRAHDLVLLKGKHRDHLSRLYFAQVEEQFGSMNCWRTDCDRMIICDLCPDLHGPPRAWRSTHESTAPVDPPDPEPN